MCIKNKLYLYMHGDNIKNVRNCYMYLNNEKGSTKDEKDQELYGCAAVTCDDGNDAGGGIACYSVRCADQ